MSAHLSRQSPATLAAAYLARSCALCGGTAAVTRVGDNQRRIADVDLCLVHGLGRWPWTTHPAPKRSREARR